MYTLIDAAGAVVGIVNNERTTRADDERESRSDPGLAAAVECDLTQATTNSYACQPEAANHQMIYALRSASRSPEASEPHLANGFFETRVKLRVARTSSSCHNRLLGRP